MRFAAVQLDTVAMEVNLNVHRALHAARRAFEAGATHVFFHEALTADYTPDPLRYGRSLDSHEVHHFIQLAGRYGGYVALGLNEVHEGRPYISCVYVSGGGVEAVYRKSFLAPHAYSGQGVSAAYWRSGSPSDARLHALQAGEWVQHRRGYRRESGILAAGGGTESVRVGELLFGTLICADAQHPDAWDTFRRDPPDVLFFQSNSAAGGGRALAACREIARELRVPIVATNRVGFSHAFWMRGGSFLVADDGEVVAQANEDGQEETIAADWAALTPRRSERLEQASAAR